MLVCCLQGWVEELSWVQTVLLHRVIFLPQLFADWGVDYLKMDGCFADPLTFDEGYPTVTRALNDSGRHIVFSCSWPAYQVWGGMKVKQLIFLSSFSVVQN